MNRREMMGKTLASSAGVMTFPKIANAEETKDAPRFKGVGVLRYPQGYGSTVEDAERRGKLNREIAQNIAENVREGSVIAFPNNRDSCGEYDWDFRIEGGDPGQVKVVRGDVETQK